VYLHDNFIFTAVIKEINAWIEVKHEEDAGLMVVRMVKMLCAACLNRFSRKRCRQCLWSRECGCRIGRNKKTKLLCLEFSDLLCFVLWTRCIKWSPNCKILSACMLHFRKFWTRFGEIWYGRICTEICRCIELWIVQCLMSASVYRAVTQNIDLVWSYDMVHVSVYG